MAISWTRSELGSSALQPNQELVVRHFSPGSDVFVLLPTGSSTSLCFCLLPRAFNFLRQGSGRVKRIHSDCSQPTDIANARPCSGNDGS